MTHEYSPRFSIPLAPNTKFTCPPQPPPSPDLLHLYDSAMHVMTDFDYATPHTVTGEVQIDAALDHMKTAGVRLLLVIDDDSYVIGIITAKDIQGEEPIRLMEQSRIDRAHMTVSAIMTPQPDIPVLPMLSVRDAQIGHIVETLNTLERQHILVVDTEAESGAQTVRGVFSTSQISKQLHADVAPGLAAAHSLSEMVHDVTQG
ncbi:MAG: CBS domain-containing protein [Gammaproteobacteria bacterium]|nr:CBS domain-containing protein [Gammaproteobacteria bacterium]MDH3466232.1 CBS domain-containing protein [Gammaproteobacteria bacterium]